MVDTSDVAVVKAMLTRLALLSTSPDATLIAYPNVAFTPPVAGPNVKWYRATILPAPTFTTGVGNDAYNEISGILQVDALMFPGSGELPVARMAQTVMNWFARGTELVQDTQGVRIVRTPYRGQLLKDDPWVFIPVSIPYLAYSPNP